MDMRKRRILKAIVDEYIQNAEPVGSKSLVDRHNMDISPATLRHEMAALEEMGYLEQPHTSAGRIPTPRGYRLYVDELMQRHRLSQQEMLAVNDTMRLRIQELDKLISEAGRLVAGMTRYATVAASPHVGVSRLQKVELFPAEPSALVIVVVLEGGVVKNKWLRLAALPSAQTITRLTASINTVFSGQTAISFYDVERCIAMTGEGSELLHPILEFLSDVFKGTEHREVFLSGESHLLSQPEYRDVLKARRTLEYLSEQRHSLSLLPLDKPDGVKIMIGPENAATELSDASVILASFPISDGQSGLIGVVGPTRMDYSKLASHLTYIAARLGRLLQHEEEESP